MKKRKLSSLQFNIWCFFIIFAICIIAILWVLQIMLFDINYQRQKINTIVNTGNELAEKFNLQYETGEDHSVDIINTAIESNEDGLLPYLVYRNDEDKLIIESIYYYMSPSDNSNDSQNEIDRELIEKAVNQYNTQNDSDSLYLRLTVQNESYYVYITKVKSHRGDDDYLIIKGSAKSMVESVKVIQNQLIVVSVVAIVISFFLAWFLSSKLSRPITEMSKTAKKWAKGDQSVSFSSNDYEELKELAETLNYAKEGINQSGALQRDLLANVSHDLKTPLTMIKAYAEMIRDLSGNVKEKREAHTQVIIDEADRLTMLVNDILDLSKLQNNNNLNIEQVNLSELCETVIYRFNDFAVNNGYTIEKDIESDLFVECDEQKIEQVLYNLIGNSINYTGENKTIMVKLSRNNGKVLFESIDSGKGISEDKIKTIWEKYYRYSETHQRPIKGTGLGLSIVRTILEAHNLRFGVISKKEIGSNFFIEFKDLDDE